MFLFFVLTNPRSLYMWKRKKKHSFHALCTRDTINSLYNRPKVFSNANNKIWNRRAFKNQSDRVYAVPRPQVQGIKRLNPILLIYFVFVQYLSRTTREYTRGSITKNLFDIVHLFPMCFRERCFDSPLTLRFCDVIISNSDNTEEFHSMIRNPVNVRIIL